MEECWVQDPSDGEPRVGLPDYRAAGVVIQPATAPARPSAMGIPNIPQPWKDYWVPQLCKGTERGQLPGVP